MAAVDGWYDYGMTGSLVVIAHEVFVQKSISRPYAYVADATCLLIDFVPLTAQFPTSATFQSCFRKASFGRRGQAGRSASVDGTMPLGLKSIEGSPTIIPVHSARSPDPSRSALANLPAGRRHSDHRRRQAKVDRQGNGVMF